MGKKPMQVATQSDAISALTLFNTPHRYGTQQKALPSSSKQLTSQMKNLKM